MSLGSLTYSLSTNKENTLPSFIRGGHLDIRDINSLKVAGYTEQQSVYIFVIEVTTKFSTYLVGKRYTQFANLFACFQQPPISFNFPEFPTKVYFPFKINEAILKQRKALFSLFLKNLLVELQTKLYNIPHDAKHNEQSAKQMRVEIPFLEFLEIKHSPT